MIQRDRDLSQPVETLHENEKLKGRSHNLRGAIAHGLEDA